MVKAKAGWVLHPIPTPHFSLDSGASTSAVQSESLGLGSGNSKSVSRPGFSGRVYQRRKIRNHQSLAVWKVKGRQNRMRVRVRARRRLRLFRWLEMRTPFRLLRMYRAVGVENRKSCN